MSSSCTSCINFSKNKILVILLIILSIIYYFPNKNEKFQNPLSSMASSISNPILQEGGPNIDISKIDFSKLSDEEYSQLLTLLSGSYLNPLIKNLVPT
jgi:hypothetical protein